MNHVDELITTLTHPDRRSAERAKSALLSVGDEAVEPLLEALALADAKGCWKILPILGKLRDPRAVPAVSKHLRSDHGLIRTAAAECLGEIGDPQATIPLLAALQETRADEAPTWIVQALGQLADPRAVDALLAVMQETDLPSTRYTAIEALAQIGDRRAIEPIKQYLHDPSHHVRSRAEMALACLGDGEAYLVADSPSI